jgi:aryl-alcohol dehydrogenase
VPKLIEAAVGALKPCGTCVLLGASHENEIRLQIMPLISGRVIRGVVNGDCRPEELIPKLVDMYMAGEFPIDRLAGFYALDEINRAIADTTSGATIKPIIRF